MRDVVVISRLRRRWHQDQRRFPAVHVAQLVSLHFALVGAASIVRGLRYSHDNLRQSITSCIPSVAISCDTESKPDSSSR